VAREDKGLKPLAMAVEASKINRFHPISGNNDRPYTSIGLRAKIFQRNPPKSPPFLGLM